MTFQRIGIVGAGQMGSGIAQVFALAGMDIVICDPNAMAFETGMAGIRNSLGRLEAKEKISADQVKQCLSRIQCEPELDSLVDADLVIEAVSENEVLKKQIFASLDQICQPNTILASNTSSISITRLAAETQRPDRVIGTHFMNPVPVMKLVEVIRALQTDDEVFESINALMTQIGKTPVAVKDGYGFVANRILVPMLNEAVFTFYEGLASAEEIDTVMMLGANHPMGPLALADMIGLDTVLSIMEVLYDGYNDPKYRPCPLLKQMVDAGYLGRKSGRGFYTY